MSTNTTRIAKNAPQAFYTNWEGRQHLSGKAETQTVRTPEGKKYRALVSGTVIGVYNRRKDARNACSQRLRRMGLKAGIDWQPKLVELERD
jgi:hypothetical protein